MAQPEYFTSQGQIMLHKPLLPMPGKYKTTWWDTDIDNETPLVKNQKYKCHHQNRINWLRVARPYRRVWRWESSSLNNYPDIKLFAIQKNRSEWLRKLTNRQRNTCCNQNLGRRRSKKEKKRTGKIKIWKEPRIWETYKLWILKWGTLLCAIWTMSSKKPGPREETLKVEALGFLGKERWWRNGFLCFSDGVKRERVWEGGIAQNMECCSNIMYVIALYLLLHHYCQLWNMFYSNKVLLDVSIKQQKLCK